MPLEAFVQKQAEFIFTAKVDKLDPEKPSVVLEAGEAIKGKVPIQPIADQPDRRHLRQEEHAHAATPQTSDPEISRSWCLP